MTTNVSNRRRGTSLLIVLSIALTTVVAVGVGVEFYARHKVTSCMSHTLEGELGGPVDVSLGAKPLLLTALDHKVSQLNIRSDDASISGIGGATLQGFQLDSSFHDVELPASDGSGGTIGSSEANIVWPAPAILSSLQTLPIGMLITGVQLDSTANSIHVQLAGGISSITLRPGVAGGAITMTTTEVTALGFGLPNDLPQQIIDQITGNLGEYPLGLAPESVKVADAGLTIQLQGGRAALIADSTADSTAGSGCSIF
ncbi:LmeA family phospholipid-binding protein [Tomitella biformata]|uniref:LmeA family phospholipid-binding protein n=1 Tax=Tomitella biformata TaxID=630403 RepID=UPI000463A992|nr:DUF2993 domain-containing protein [Tomitella biformata]